MPDVRRAQPHFPLSALSRLEDRAGVADRFLAGRLSPQCQRARWIATRRAAR
jgi:hypothetical protein